jgi:hypothetical protein
MSEENVELAATELIRKWVDAWNREDLDTFVSAFDDDAVVITDPSWMEPGPFVGRAAVSQWYAALREAWGGRDTNVITELFDVGESVLARMNWEVQGRFSGIETVLDITCISRIEHGRIVRQQWYFDYQKAIEAVGLSE